MIYLFSYCEYGGGEIATCRLVCDPEFADGFERGLNLMVNDEAYYVLRSELGDGEPADGVAEIDPWSAAA